MCTTYNRIMYICNVLRKQIHSVTYFCTQSYVFYLEPMSINTKIMLKEEFIKLMGIAIPDNAYLEIDARYNKSGMSKEDFCKKLKKEGYVQEITEYMVAKINSLEDSHKSVCHTLTNFQAIIARKTRQVNILLKMHAELLEKFSELGSRKENCNEKEERK